MTNEQLADEEPTPKVGGGNEVDDETFVDQAPDGDDIPDESANPNASRSVDADDTEA